jgi:hypothetical protein
MQMKKVEPNPVRKSVFGFLRTKPAWTKLRRDQETFFSRNFFRFYHKSPGNPGCTVFAGKKKRIPGKIAYSID